MRHSILSRLALSLAFGAGVLELHSLLSESVFADSLKQSFPVPKLTSQPSNGSDGEAAKLVNLDPAKNRANGPCNYLGVVQMRIRRAWRPPADGNAYKIKLVFTISKDGSVSNTHVSQSSGNRAADKAAIDAVTSLGKIATLPEKSPDHVDVEFTLEFKPTTQSLIEGHVVSSQ
jgi:TonB family protein